MIFIFPVFYFWKPIFIMFPCWIHTCYFGNDRTLKKAYEREPKSGILKISTSIAIIALQQYREFRL